VHEHRRPKRKENAREILHNFKIKTEEYGLKAHTTRITSDPKLRSVPLSAPSTNKSKLSQSNTMK